MKSLKLRRVGTESAVHENQSVTLYISLVAFAKLSSTDIAGGCRRMYSCACEKNVEIAEGPLGSVQD